MYHNLFLMNLQPGPTLNKSNFQLFVTVLIYLVVVVWWCKIVEEAFSGGLEAWCWSALGQFDGSCGRKMSHQQLC